MQRVVVFVLWIIFSLLAQTVILPDFPSVRVWTDFLFYLIIILGLRFSLVSGIVLAAVIGHVADVFSVVPYGTSIISYIATLIFIRMVIANIYLENRISLFVWIGIFSFFKQSVQFFIFTMRPDYSDISIFIFARMFLQSLWDALLGLFIVPFLEKAIFSDWVRVFRKKGLRI